MKTKYIRTFTAVALMAAAATFNACHIDCVKGSGTEKSEDRKVTDFTKLDISGGYKVVLKQDSSLSVHISADDNLLQYIRTDVEGDVLKIYTKRSLCSNNPVVVNIGVKNLEQIDNSGAIELSDEGTLNVKDFMLHLAGASKVDLSLNAANVMTKGSGNSEIKLKGQAASHDVKLTGAGDLEALDFVVSSYNIEATGAVECKVNALKELNVHSTGAAEIEYKGNPSINSSKTGAATIKKID